MMKLSLIPQAELADHEGIDTDILFNQMDDASGAHRRTMLSCNQQ